MNHLVCGRYGYTKHNSSGKRGGGISAERLANQTEDRSSFLLSVTRKVKEIVSTDGKGEACAYVCCLERLGKITYPELEKFCE